MHVDDMTFSGTEHWVEDVLIANLKQRYKVTYTIAKKAGDEFSFLKRAFTLSDDGGIVVSPSASHINGLVEKFEEFTQQRAKPQAMNHFASRTCQSNWSLLKQRHTDPLLG